MKNVHVLFSAQDPKPEEDPKSNDSEEEEWCWEDLFGPRGQGPRGDGLMLPVKCAKVRGGCGCDAVRCPPGTLVVLAMQQMDRKRAYLSVVNVMLPDGQLWPQCRLHDEGNDDESDNDIDFGESDPTEAESDEDDESEDMESDADTESDGTAESDAAAKTEATAKRDAAATKNGAGDAERDDATTKDAAAERGTTAANERGRPQPKRRRRRASAPEATRCHPSA